jgi:hypothetical protein
MASCHESKAGFFTFPNYLGLKYGWLMSMEPVETCVYN